MTASPVPEYAVEEFYASRRPVRRFALGLATAAAVLVVVWWAGLFAPRLSSPGSSGQFDRASGAGVVEVELTNEAPTPVRVHDVELIGATEVLVAQLDGVPLGDQPTLAGSGTAVLRLEFRAPRCIGSGYSGGAPLRLTVRTAASVMRTDRATVSAVTC